jgi:hypothetical protein
MNTVKLVSISTPKLEKDGQPRADGKANRLYYTATFSNPANPFNKTVSRTFWQQHNSDGTIAEWKGADPKDVRLFIGKEIPGKIVAANVKEYDVVDKLTGDTRTASTFTTVVLDGELAETVFKASGREIVKAAAMTVVEQQEAENPAF